MRTYHKIQSMFKRDQKGKMLFGEFSLPEFEYLKDLQWEFTEKVDGTNIRIVISDGSISIKGKTNNAQLHPTLLENIEAIIEPNREQMLEKFRDGACLYGEGYGPKIQSGGKYRSSPSFVLFDVLVDKWWLKRESVESIGDQLSMDVVPVVSRGTLKDMEIICAESLTSTWGDFEAEGLVARPVVELKSRAGGRIITKLKCKDFRK